MTSLEVNLVVKSRHTPGPWQYNPQSANRVTGPDGQIVAATYGGMTDDEEQVANTRLIASAPAMYDFIEKKALDGDQEAQAMVAGIETEADAS